jgi:hypothetical protein
VCGGGAAEKCGHIDPTVYANDIRELDKIVDGHWTKGANKPLVIGPDCNPIGGDWVAQFLRNASDVLNVYTYQLLDKCHGRKSGLTEICLCFAMPILLLM